MFRVLVVLALAAGTAARAQESAAQAPPAPASQQPVGQPSPAADAGGFASDAEKGSYAVGYSLGQMIRLRKLDVQSEPVIAGLRDGIAGSGRMSEEEATILARSIQNEGMRRVQKEKAELAAKNRAEGTAFLDANKKRTGVVALPSGLQYEVLRPGSGPKPAIDDAVKVSFRGTLLDGTVFDSSEGRSGPIVVRPDQVIKGWTEVLPIMPVGSKWKLFVPAELGYGDNVSAANIPPGATLIFEVELLSIEPKAKDPQAPGSEKD